MPVTGGEEVEVVPNLASYGNFAVASDGLDFEARLPGNPLGHTPDFTPFTRLEAAIDFLSFATGKVSRGITLDRHAGHDFACPQTSGHSCSHRWTASQKI